MGDWQDNSEETFRTEHANVGMAYNVYKLALEENAEEWVLVGEWPERAWTKLPHQHLLVRLEWAGADSSGRRLTLEPRGARYDELVHEMAGGRRRRR